MIDLLITSNYFFFDNVFYTSTKSVLRFRDICPVFTQKISKSPAAVSVYHVTFDVIFAWSDSKNCY